MLIRKAASLDLPALAMLHAAVAEELRALVPDGFGLPPESARSRSEITGKLRDMLDDSDCMVLVAEVDGKLAGLATGFCEAHNDDVFEAPFLTVEYVEVDPAFRGRGIARALIAALEEDGRSRGLKHADLLVLQTNEPARQLYAELGYTPLELRLGKLL